MTSVMSPPPPEENARRTSSGFATSESSLPAISPWPSSRPTRSSRSRARSSPAASAPSSASTTATAAPIAPAMSVITCSTISKLPNLGFLNSSFHRPAASNFIRAEMLPKLLYKMVCEPDETDLNMHIPAVMLPLDAGTRLEKMLTTTSSVSVQLHSPLRPAVDVAEVFLWMMAVLTILCASYWSAWTTREAAIEQDKLLKDASDELPNTKYASVSGVVNMNVKAAVLFVVFASCFLFMLYKLMSSWFIDVLVVLFCIGGIEDQDALIPSTLENHVTRWFKHAGESYIKVPFLGAISLEYMPFLLSFFFFLNGGVWLLYVVLVRDVILGGIALIITVLQIVHVPNLKVQLSDTTLGTRSPIRYHKRNVNSNLYHPSALNTFEQIVYSAKGKQIVVFLDYDGTLSLIVTDPDKAFMTRKMKATLKGISRHFPTTIVTGREHS
ncbi:hypothetical protein JHK87_015655 [Glycine soja]|nr:hypothetical protein JHK87_015655 [Glycine soja]